MILTKIQKKQLKEKGITKEQLQMQLDRFEKGFPVVKLNAAATLDHGIVKLNSKIIDRLIEQFEKERNELSIIKFVPASGAASRMFKFLHEFMHAFDPKTDSINSYINQHSDKDLFTFFSALEKFPFFETVVSSLKSSTPDWENKTSSERRYLFVEQMMLGNGCSYAPCPAGRKKNVPSSSIIGLSFLSTAIVSVCGF